MVSNTVYARGSKRSHTGGKCVISRVNKDLTGEVKYPTWE